MKHCPVCRSQYSDATLRFCLQDGAILHDGETKQSTIDTISFSDPVTADNILRTEEMNLFAPPITANKTQKWSPAPPKSALRRDAATEKSKSSAKIWLAVVPLLLAMAGVGVGGWLYLKNQTDSTVKSAKPAETSTPEIAAQAPPANTSDSTSKIILDDLSNTGSEDAKKEIADAVEGWRQAIEARKVPDYLSKYAEKADYFDKTGATAAEIRTEAQKMFETYSDIDINLSNVRVAVDAEATQATAVFDKEWSYQTDKDLLEGKARTKLHFQKNGKEWKIVSEKYQKIYYTEN